uniref:Uncharacterized protein n=1 Tax=Peronospora matthiolae TaxID=2874970 RepID=A0AAV1UPV8_9STRA
MKRLLVVYSGMDTGIMSGSHAEFYLLPLRCIATRLLTSIASLAGHVMTMLGFVMPAEESSLQPMLASRIIEIVVKNVYGDQNADNNGCYGECKRQRI